MDRFLFFNNPIQPNLTIFHFNLHSHNANHN